MGVVADFVEGIGDAIKTWLASGVEGLLNTSQNLLTVGLDTSQTNGVGGMIQQYLAGDVTSWTGGATASGTSASVWSIIEKVTDEAVVPIAGLIFTIVVISDLIQMVISGNNFKDFDDSIFIRWIIKVVCGILLISNVFYLASGFMAFGTTATKAAMSTLLDDDSLIFSMDLDITADASLYNIGEWLVYLLLALFVMLIIVVMLAVIVVVMASRMIEIFMYLSASPIPVATLMGGAWGEVGKNWIRNMFALAFQGLFIVIALGIFSTIFTHVLSTFGSGAGNLTVQFVLLIGFGLALIFTVLRSSAISKSIFGAH